RSSIARQPLENFSSVTEPCARNQPGNRNHARGETSMKTPLMAVIRPTTATIHQPAVSSIDNIRDSSGKRHAARDRQKPGSTNSKRLTTLLVVSANTLARRDWQLTPASACTPARHPPGDATFATGPRGRHGKDSSHRVYRMLRFALKESAPLP